MLNKVVSKGILKVITISIFTLFFIVPTKLYSQTKNIPSGYRNITLGLSLDETKASLKKDSVFGYRGDRDVSLLPTEERILIETPGGSSFVGRSWFQFYQDKLYIITININQEIMDYYSIFSTLSKKYGEPDSLSPEKCVWQGENVTMSLEKPLTLKYVETSTFTMLQEKSNIEKAGTEYSRELFLDEL